MEFNKMNQFLKPSPAGEGGVRRNKITLFFKILLLIKRY